MVEQAKQEGDGQEWPFKPPRIYLLPSAHWGIVSKTNWRKIAIALIDTKKGKEKTQACANA